MTRSELLARIATATGHRRKAERIADAETADAVIDAVVDWLREHPFVANGWGGTQFLNDILALKSAPGEANGHQNGASHGSAA